MMDENNLSVYYSISMAIFCWTSQARMITWIISERRNSRIPSVKRGSGREENTRRKWRVSCCTSLDWFDQCGIGASWIIRHSSSLSTSRSRISRETKFKCLLDELVSLNFGLKMKRKFFTLRPRCHPIQAPTSTWVDKTCRPRTIL